MHQAAHENQECIQRSHRGGASRLRKDGKIVSGVRAANTDAMKAEAVLTFNARSFFPVTQRDADVCLSPIPQKNERRVFQPRCPKVREGRVQPSLHSGIYLSAVHHTPLSFDVFFRLTIGIPAYGLLSTVSTAFALRWLLLSPAIPTVINFFRHFILLCSFEFPAT